MRLTESMRVMLPLASLNAAPPSLLPPVHRNPTPLPKRCIHRPLAECFRSHPSTQQPLLNPFDRCQIVHRNPTLAARDASYTGLWPHVPLAPVNAATAWPATRPEWNPTPLPLRVMHTDRPFRPSCFRSHPSTLTLGVHLAVNPSPSPTSSSSPRQYRTPADTASTDAAARSSLCRALRPPWEPLVSFAFPAGSDIVTAPLSALLVG